MDKLETLRADPDNTGVFLDFDGTLSPMVSDPDAAAIVTGAREVLEGLARRYAIVAFISGRGAEDLRSRVRAEGPRYFGLYGAEEMTESGLEQSPLAPGWRQSAAELAAGALEVIDAERLVGCEVELKDLAVSVHFRGSGRKEPPDLLMEWARTAAGAAGFRSGVGRKVIELRPELVSKAETFQRLALEAGVRNVLVAGDDSADVEMMRRASQLMRGGVVRVGMRSAEEPSDLAEQADLQVGSPAELVATLQLLL
jgi:trehalose 6-phosphate phosphatase